MQQKCMVGTSGRSRTMSGRRFGGRAAIFVSDSNNEFFQRVVDALQGVGTTVERTGSPAHLRGLFGEHAVAIVSVDVLPTERAWYDLEHVPIIWVGSKPYAGLMPDPTGDKYLLALDFTDTALVAMLDTLRPLMRVNDAKRLLDGHKLVAESEPMLDLIEEVCAFSGSDQNVLIEGETGVGKELIAQILHAGHSRFSKGPFVVVNCGAVPDGLFESLFFGHVRGAFTGALQAHKGYFEQASGGTLFLDEVGDLPQLQQVKLLRVLQDSSVMRVGSESLVQLDFRLITATNRKLAELVRQGSFRADLFYRLAVIELNVPNLAERGALDKIAIFRYLLKDIFESASQAPQIAIPEWLIAQVGSLPFPGNVRQLQNLAERIGVIVRQTGDWDMRLINRALEKVHGMGAVPNVPSTKRLFDADERDCIVSMLDKNGWQRQKTADQMGMSRKSLWEKMRKYGIGNNAGQTLLPALTPALPFASS